MARAHIYILSFASSRSLSFSHFHFIVFVMPRSIILRPPGGDSGIKRKRYSAREKIAILAKIRRIKRETGLSYRKAAASLGVSHTLVIRWRALRERFDNLDLKRLPRYSVAHGPCSQLEGVTEELLAWIFERREMGLVVSTLSVIIKACCILPIMEQKSALARVVVIRRFLKKHSLVYRMGTKVSQRSPGEVGEEATEFQEFIRPMLLGPERSLHWIINMDQTPVFFSMHPKKTLEILGTKTVVILLIDFNLVTFFLVFHTWWVVNKIGKESGASRMASTAASHSFFFVITLFQLASALTELSESPTAVNSTNTPSRK
jgi:transposase-like protein